MIEIKSISGEVLLSVPILKDAISHEELMTSDYVQLSWDSEKGDVLPMGAYVEYEGEMYSLLEPYHPTRQNEAAYRYTPQFHSRIMRWQKIIVPVYSYNEDGVTVKSRELDWTFTGTPADAMYMVKQTLRNELGEVWDISVGEDLPETVTIVAQSSSVWSVLSELAELCETEWWANKKSQSLNLSKCEHGVSITLEVGKDVKVPSSVRSTEEYFTRFYAFGSSRNITQMDSVVQGSIVNKRLTLDPVKYPEGYKDIKGHFEGGRYVSDLTPEEVLVKSLYFEDVYPSSPLTISSVRKRMRYRLDENDNKIRKGGSDDTPIYEQYAIWYFKVADFEFTEDLIIEGLTLSVAFKSGQLRGREFELAYHSETKKAADNADVDAEFTVQAGEYEIIFDESDGLIIPSVDYLVPSAGDEVVFFNIEMPDEYKEAAHTKLEAELDKEIARLLKDNNAYEFESNPVSFFENETSVHLGQRVNFINAEFILPTRVQMIEKHLDYPCEQKIRIGNEIVKGSRQQLRDEVRNVGEEVSRMNKKGEYYGAAQRGSSRDLMLTMGRFYAMQDTIDMLQGAVEGYTEGINPITVETMAMLVGNEALQFKFTRSTSDFNTIQCPLVYDPAVKKLYAGTCALFHLTLGINEIASVRDVNDYKSWTMEAWQSEIFDDPKKRYYVYAKVEKDGMLGTYVCSETTIGMEQYSQYYHLLVGILNAEYVETREFLPLYGFTQILPGQITTDVIRSADGSCVFDLANNKIEGRITFVNNEGVSTEMEDFVNELDEHLLGLQNQIDGAIETWFYEADPPTLSNAPANEWDDDAKAAHVGDLYYSGKGNAFRFQKDSNGSYYWKQIEDEDISKALGNAQEALAAAEEAGKAATEAKAEADSAKARIDNMMKDGVFDQSEKSELYTEYERVLAEYAEITSSAQKYDVNYTAYKTAYENYKSALNQVLDYLAYKETVSLSTFSSYQSAYYNALTSITQAIAEAAKAVADAAKAAADEAATKADAAQKAAAEAATMATAAKEDAQAAMDAANAVTGKIDGDNYLTEIEKQSIRRIIAEITECKKTLYTETAKLTLTAKQGNAWYKVTRESRAEWTDSSGKSYSVSQKDYEGYYSSKMHTASGTTVTQIDAASLYKDFTLGVEYLTDSEASYDFLTISPKGLAVNTSLTTNSTSEAAGGSTYGARNQKRTKTYNMTSEMASSKRFVQVGYKKNSSTDTGTDSGYFRITNNHYVDSSGGIHVVELNGSFHSYYLMLNQAGYTTIASQLATRLENIFTLLNSVDVWEVGTKTLSSGSTFRADLNTALTEYFVALAACGFNVMDSKVSDLNYLTNAMRNGSTVVDGGLVMTSLVAVGDTDDIESTDVDAFLNGSQFAQDSTHGKLLLAGGIPAVVTENGVESTNLEKRAKNASTRIYEDGRIISNDIEANGGSFKNVTVQGSITQPFDMNGTFISKSDNYVNLNTNSYTAITLPTSIEQSGRRITFKGKFIVTCGLNILVNGVGSTSVTLENEILVLVAIPTSSTQVVWHALQRTPFGVSAYSDVRENGTFAGLRPSIKYHTSGALSLTELDHTVIINNTAAVAINLPSTSTAKDGQEYEILCLTTSQITINGTLFNLVEGAAKSTDSFTSKNRRKMKIVYSKSYGKWVLDYQQYS